LRIADCGLKDAGCGAVTAPAILHPASRATLAARAIRNPQSAIRNPQSAMTFLPIVQRELIEASRRRGTYGIRLLAAGLGLGLGAVVMFILREGPAAEMGIWLFRVLAVAVHSYCLFVGVLLAADCLSEEKREGTLGLLFLTDLKGYDIVLGKLVATSLNAFYGVLALFPVMAIPLLLGGVTLGEFGRVVLVAMNLLLFSLATGMFCSSISRDERNAMVKAFLLVLFFAAGVPLLAGLSQEWIRTRSWGEYLLIPSPSYAATMAFDAMFRGGSGSNHFYPSVVFTHGLSWVLLLASSLIVPRTWQDRALSADTLRRRGWLNRLGLGSARERGGFRARLLELNPVYWLTARNRMKGLVVWLFLACGGVIWCLGLAFRPQDWKDETAYLGTALIAHTALKFWVAGEATRRFSLDRRSGALELLLATPLSIRDVVRGQWMGLERQFAGPVVVVLLADFVFLLNDRHQSYGVLFWVAFMVIFVADVITLSWLSMWRGLNSRHPNRAAVVALAWVLVLPWAAVTLMTILGALDWLIKDHWDENHAILFILGVFLVFNAAFALPARHWLLTRFREIATQPFESRAGRRG